MNKRCCTKTKERFEDLFSKDKFYACLLNAFYQKVFVKYQIIPLNHIFTIFFIE
jgi:hypothetical protein